MTTVRPAVPTEHANEKEHRRLLANRANASLAKDGTDGMTAPLKLAMYTVAGAPDPVLWRGALIYVTDEVGGEVPAFSDGSAWLRVTDRTAIS